MLIDCNTMVFNAAFNAISFISRWPVHLPILSWYSFCQYSAQYSFQTTGYSPTIAETMYSDERGMNPVAMTIISPQKEYWTSLGIELATSCSQVLYTTD